MTGWEGTADRWLEQSHQISKQKNNQETYQTGANNLSPAVMREMINCKSMTLDSEFIRSYQPERLLNKFIQMTQPNTWARIFF